jgi:NTE family protein
MNSSPLLEKNVESTTSSNRSRLDRHPLPIANTEPTPSRGGRALVLGGGGSSGNAWSIGIIAGLLHAGLHLERADLIVGTSAGATTAAQITGMPPAKLYAAMLATTPQPSPGPTGPEDGRASTGPVNDQLERTGRIIASAADAADMRRKMGAAAIELDAASDASRQTQWRATVAARLPSQQWPERTMYITAVDAETGEPVIFDRHSGVDLVDAVAASCSSGAAYRIGDRR